MHAYDYRSQARWALKGKWKVMILIMLLAQVVMSGFGLTSIAQSFFSQPFVLDGAAAGMEGYQLTYSIPVGPGWLVYGLGQLIMLLSNVVLIGLYRVCAVVLQGGWPDWRQIFPMKLFFKALWMNIVRGLLVFLQLLLFIVPGLIALYRYSMADYLLAENPDLGPIEALRRSGVCMKGSKARLFSLHISFLGWALLASLVPMAVVLLLVGLPAQLLMAVELIAGWVSSCILDVYMFTSETAFYSDLLHGSAKRDWREAQRAAWQQEQQAYDVPEEESQPQQEPSRADEAAAKELFMGHQCSLEKLRRAGCMEEYEELNPSRMGEESWKRDYAQLLMRRFDQDESALDDLLALCAEYALDDLADRALQRIERHLRQETLPGAEILNMAGRLLAVLTSGAFAGNEGFVGRKQADIARMADRLEEKLQAQEPDGEWKQALVLVRRMCE